MTFKAYKLYSFIIISFVFVSSCEKDKQIINSPDNYCPVCDSCANFIKDTLGGIPREAFELFDERKAPCFNPLDANEFVFIKEQDSSRKSSLVKYNMFTHNETTLLENILIDGQPKWGNNGLITFINNYQICIIKADGSGFKRLTSFPYFEYPDWKNDSIIACKFTENLSYPNYYGELNIFTAKLDTLRNKYFNLGAFNRLHEKAYNKFWGDANIIYENIDSSVLLTNNSSDGKNEIVCISWHPNNQDIYFSKVINGIFKINKKSNTEILIKKGCNSRGYKLISMSPDGRKILVERVDATLENIKLIYLKSDIYIMDIDGRNEEKVFK
ncbi:MAG: hypothetical protein NTU43_10750 [Bacteroidetes bacterium]|nr:hypothetical protein [Bacteroidota bacterium]